MDFTYKAHVHVYIVMPLILSVSEPVLTWSWVGISSLVAVWVWPLFWSAHPPVSAWPGQTPPAGCASIADCTLYEWERTCEYHCTCSLLNSSCSIHLEHSVLDFNLSEAATFYLVHAVLESKHVYRLYTHTYMYMYTHNYMYMYLLHYVF